MQYDQQAREAAGLERAGQCAEAAVEWAQAHAMALTHLEREWCEHRSLRCLHALKQQEKAEYRKLRLTRNRQR
jgi:hypothetical protein